MDDIQIEHPRPIPIFYCCYLLRSTVRHASLYIGSTPNPARRLIQHNGVVKGGARRTAAEKLRPWEMVLVVEGFTSRLAALQFEWAWQNPWYSRHLRSEESSAPAEVKHRRKRKAKSEDPESLDSNCDSAKSKDKATPKKSKRRPRPPRSLDTHFSDLHRLLRSTYFSHWPLQIRFFSGDLYQSWNAWYDRVDVRLRSPVKVILDGSCPEIGAHAGGNDIKFGGVENAKITYATIRDYIEKAIFLLDDPKDVRCHVCQGQIVPKEELTTVCPQAECHCTCHLLCLSRKFLDAAQEPNQFIPRHGICPACEATVEWPLMMKELSFRSRAKQELLEILKRKRRDDRKQSVVTGKVESSRRRSVSVDLDDRFGQNAEDEFLLDEDWWEGLASESDSDADLRLKALLKAAPKLETVIEDSECDDAEIL
ncbi:structure-specific endonuclease subunit slx1 [Aspergillus lentulus]|uniref:Structure-specific endonuclease subunit slx1 n=1 Tax=Aspergillus lentulus TaxID=293939 RepID=A0ABQ1AHI5_ASPLE|nr:structure-specific endonuclease subunit slx1 [Aspergillus lentulus]GFF40618.1 structure-specific endonuclease subunit slx1 [Aspergillus lentulus]GFF62307.1 structure-specific endonuclease subunit slx1 [Aspergillus lentulus]GFF82020.1 structure-specific endonuclease subunit slx1 [Aspergillus lentulus]GFF86380.1 structure-specific endonuclease subunit slx1 [Aspergillus lentulus]GFG13382.1 structure-specific endonuclease subunit slx1 [Aspergillus lentulus]